MRTLGSLGMSVGTSLAFEEMPAGGLVRVDSFLVNIRTLVRNAQQAYEVKSSNYNNVEVIYKDVKKDIELLAKHLNNLRGNSPRTLTLYYTKNEGFKSKYPFAVLWEPTTERQKAFHYVAKQITTKLLKEYKDVITVINVGVPSYMGQGVVLTHHPIDLAECNSIGRLKLLESHTGNLKGYTEWYTKLTGGNDLFYMPLNRLTIQTFGDKSTDFKSQSQGIKDIVKDLAVKKKWTSATSFAKVKSDINSLPYDINKAGLLKMI